MTTKVRRVLKWLVAGNDLMSPGMADSLGLNPAERTSMVKYLRLKGYVEATGPVEYRVAPLGIALLQHVHKTDERILARQRKDFRCRAKARQATDQVVSFARCNVPNSVFAMGAML